MGKLNYVNNVINKLNDMSLSIFESFNSYIKKLRVKKKITNNAYINEYNVCDIFGIVINSCNDNTTLRDSANKNSNFNDSHLSTMYYWLKKVYDTDILDDMYYKIYQFSECIVKSIFISCNDQLINIYKNYNVLAGDGTISNVSFKNDHGKNIASYTNSIIMNTLTNLVYDHRIQFDNNELKGILDTKLTKSDIIILDRGYSKLAFMNKLAGRTNFVIRLTKNLLIYKKFMKTNKNYMTIKHNGYNIKLIKYLVDNNTRNIIKDRYANDKGEEDNDKFFVIATNLTDLSFDQITQLYKKRWSIEVCNKYIKSNFNIRHIVRQYNSSQPIKKISFYASLSILLYNIIMLEKILLERKYYYEHQKMTEYNFSKNVTLYKQYLIDSVNPCNKKILLSKKQKEHRLTVNKRSKLKKKNTNNNKKRGKYKSLDKMVKLNNRDDIILQIKEYYKKIKKINNSRQNKIVLMKIMNINSNNTT